MAGSVHVWTPGLVGFGGGIHAFSREVSLALSRDNSVQLASKSDNPGLWRCLPLWGAGRVPRSARTAYFSAGVIALALAGRPRVIVSTHVNFGPVAHLLGRTLRIPYVLVAHGVETGLTLSPNRLCALRGAARVWAVSRWTRKRVLECGVAPERISIVPNTVSEIEFDIGPQRPDLRQRYSLADGEKIILTVGRLDPREAYKGHDHIIRSLPDVRRVAGPVRYLVVGSGADRGRLEALAGEVGVRRCLTFSGFIPDAELADHYRLATVFAMPSVGEGFGVVFIEAMACGVPVLGGNRDGTTDALADGELGLLVDPTRPEQVTDGLAALLRRLGPALWFDPPALRARCLDLFGRPAFERRVHEAIRSCA